MRSFKSILTAHILIFSILLTGCSDDGNPLSGIPSEPRIEGNSYFNPELNFEISVPDGWKISSDVEFSGHKMLLWGEKNNISYSSPSFNIIDQFIGSRTSMSGFSAAAKGQIESMFEDVEFYSDRTVDAGGLVCCELLYQLKQNGVLLMQRQLYFSTDKSLVILTFSSLYSHYVQVSDDFDLIQNTLKTIR